jgi:PAS domain S-box-containing protein/putative nucleotidyltransferase with HDIG domain
MEEIPLYNSRIIKTYIEYLAKFHPNIDVNPILKDADISMHQLEDGGHWFTQQQCDNFQKTLAETTGMVDIPREAGRYAPFSKASGLVTQYTLGFITPKAAYLVLEKLYPHLSRALILQSKTIASNIIEIVAIPKPGVAESVYQCENRTGTFEAIAKLFTGQFAHIDHPICMHKGGAICKYVLSWEETQAIRWKRYKQFAVIAGFIIGALALIFHHPSYWDAIIILYLLAIFGIYNHLNHLEKEELVGNMRSKGESAEHLLNEINKRYSESLLVKEIGQATSMILDIDNLLKFIMEALEKRLDFDRGMIMLVNKERTRLVYKAGFGYQVNGKMESKSFEFHLDKPESKGVVVETFRKKKPYLVDDIVEFEKNFSERSRSVARQMEVSSFICVPIVFEQEAMGILMVDNIRSKRPLTESDVSLLMGIAPQVAISMTNAASFEKIRSSEERFKALSENAPDIIYTLDSQGMFTYVNPAWERILGHTEGEVLGKSFVRFIHREDEGLFTDNLDRIRKMRENTINLFGRLKHKNGEERLFSMSGAPNFDINGQVLGIVGTFKDITDLKRSEAELQISFNKLKSAMNSTIEAISLIVESRDPYTAGHQKRVAALAVAIAETMNMSEDQVEKIHMGSLIHDIGKIHIPAEILTKPGRLSKIEYEMMKAHPEIGFKILNAVDFIPPIVQMVYQHHERMDGSGYPLGISGTEMLLESRIIAVADTVEAMASHRPYRPAIGIEKAMDEITENKGRLYDAQVVDACLLLFVKKGFQFPLDDHSPTASNE